MANKKTYKEELDEKFKPVYDYYEMAHKWRGEIINKAIDLEQIMETFIARHYILAVTEAQYNDQLKDFRQMFFLDNSMTFGHKMGITKRLIQIHHLKYFIPHAEEDSDPITELQEILIYRNKMAHWQLDFSGGFRWNGFKDKEIKIKPMRKGDEQLFNEADLKKIVHLCNKYTTLLLHWTAFPFEDICQLLLKNAAPPK